MTIRNIFTTVSLVAALAVVTPLFAQPPGGGKIKRDKQQLDAADKQAKQDRKNLKQAQDKEKKNIQQVKNGVGGTDTKSLTALNKVENDKKNIKQDKAEIQKANDASAKDQAQLNDARQSEKVPGSRDLKP